MTGASVVTGAVVTGGFVVDVGGGTVVDTDGWVGMATLFLLLVSPLRNAKNSTSPIAHSVITTPATTRAARTSCSPLRVPCERRIESAARPASTRAMIVPMSGMTMLTTAQTSAATANGSVRGSGPHPPGPAPPPPLPVGSGSGPTGTAPVSSGFQGGSCAIWQRYRRITAARRHSPVPAMGINR